MKKTGFYIIKDKFFEDMSDPYLKGNKAGNRPHYYCLEDISTGIYWMIPLSSRINKYRRLIEKRKKQGDLATLSILSNWMTAGKAHF